MNFARLRLGRRKHRKEPAPETTGRVGSATLVRGPTDPQKARVSGVGYKSRQNELGKTLLGLQPMAAASTLQQPLPLPLSTPVSDRPEAKPRRRAVLWVAGILALGGAATTVMYSQERESTDDAHVDAYLTTVSARVIGTVTAMHVTTNQAVRAGDLLAELDGSDFEVALAGARAGLARAEAAMTSEEAALAATTTANAAAIDTAVSEVAAADAAFSAARGEIKRLDAERVKAEAQVAWAASEQQRAVTLESTGALASVERDAREIAVTTASASASAIRESIDATSARARERQAGIQAARTHLAELRDNAPRQLDMRRAATAAARANWQLAQAQVDKAQADLAYTKIRAPVAGIVGGRMASVGDPIAPGQKLFSICHTDELWITANFRETQLRRMRPGLRATIYVDALGEELLGTVESIAGATGSRFSLLPPDNASGNYVKVVQRIPIRIALAPLQPAIKRLRAGMSVVPTVELR